MTITDMKMSAEAWVVRDGLLVNFVDWPLDVTHTL
jgi:hypothetical protein